jgi:hypothetical protein
MLHKFIFYFQWIDLSYIAEQPLFILARGDFKIIFPMLPKSTSNSSLHFPLLGTTLICGYLRYVLLLCSPLKTIKIGCGKSF